MSETPDHNECYLAALEEVVKQGKTSIAIFGAPLAVIVVQIRFLAAIDSWYVSLLMTICLFCFAVGTYFAWDSLFRTQTLLAKERLLASGQGEGKGFLYLNYTEKLLGKSGIIVSEESLVEYSKKIHVPLVVLLVTGYGAILLLLLILIWQQP